MLQPLNPLPATYQSHHVHGQPPLITERVPKPTSPHIVVAHETTSPSSSKPTVLHSHKTADETIYRALNLRIYALSNVHEQKQKIGKSPPVPKQGLMWPTQQALDHDAAPLLDEYATSGCPIDCGPNWSHDQIQAALKYGAHPSAKAPQALQCLITEAETKVKNGFATIVKWKDIKNDIPPNFRLSPVAMIPHKSRAFRGILDLSFQLRHADTKFASVNANTTTTSNHKSMAQLGSALKRIIATVADGQRKNKKIFFSKLDIKDGFWRMVVNAADAWNFCHVIPNTDTNASINETNIVVPNSLQMAGVNHHLSFVLPPKLHAMSYNCFSMSLSHRTG